MKVLCGLVLIGWCLAGAVNAAESVSLNFEFQEKAQSGKVSVGEMLRRLRASVTSTGAPADDIALDFQKIYAAAARRATASELNDLAAILRQTPANFSGFDDCFSAYATAAIRQRIADLTKKPAALQWKPTAEPLPKELADAPVEFQEAWKLHRTVMAPFEAIILPPEKAKIRPAKLPPLEVDLRRTLGTPEPEAWKRLSRHVWGSWCGTGSETLYHPRNLALLLSFLADGRRHEAAGAVLSQVPDMLSFGDADRTDHLPIDLLQALGLDWEQVMLGALVPISAREGSTGRAWLGNSFYANDPAQLLAAHGSERAMHRCLDLIRRAKVSPRSAAGFLTSALGPLPKKAGDSSFSSINGPRRTVKLPAKAHQEVLAVFGEYLSPANSTSELLECLREIPSPYVKELRQPISALLTHPAHIVAAKALEMLEEEGLATGHEKIAPPPAPLPLRLLFNGKPLAYTRISADAYAPIHPTKPDRSETLVRAQWTTYGSGSNSTLGHMVAPSQVLVTNQDGELSYSLAECTDPEHLAAIRFYTPVPKLSADLDELPSIPSLELETSKHAIHEWTGPWIIHQIAIDTGNKKVTEVALHGADLEVQLKGSSHLNPGTLFNIRLERANHQTAPWSEQGTAAAIAPAGSSVFFRKLQSGEYRISIRAPGIAQYDSEVITIGRATVVKGIQLEPGRSVRGTAILPGGTKSSLPPISKLTREGVEISRYGEEWKGLPFGKYTFRIPSTTDTEEAAQKAGLPLNKISNEDRIEAREVSFTIDASTPETLDLGEIKVSREKR